MARRSLQVALAVVIAGALAVEVTADPTVDVSSGPTFLPSNPKPMFNPQLLVPTPILRRRACAADYTVPCKRGVAILSPLESPDHCDYPVGGKCILTPYYPDYCAHHKKGPRVFIPGNGVGYYSRVPMPVPGPNGQFVDENGQAIAEAGYGAYQGARQDEDNLLRLGGLSGQGDAMIDADKAGREFEVIEAVPHVP